MANPNAAGIKIVSDGADTFSTTGTTTGFTAGSGTAVLDDSTFTGDSGTTAYTIGDIVAMLKQQKLLED